jgi:hypothetical protein
MNRLTTTLRERQAEAARLDVAIAASLGDRVMLTRLERRGGRSVVEYVTSGPNEPRCCPTQQVEAVCALRKSLKRPYPCGSSGSGHRVASCCDLSADARYGGVERRHPDVEASLHGTTDDGQQEWISSLSTNWSKAYAK